MYIKSYLPVHQYNFSKSVQLLPESYAVFCYAKNKQKGRKGAAAAAKACSSGGSILALQTQGPRIDPWHRIHQHGSVHC